MSQKVTLKSLQAQCTAYGLKTYGTKETLLNRIKEHEASVEEKPNNTASNESSSELNLILMSRNLLNILRLNGLRKIKVGMKVLPMVTYHRLTMD